MRRELCFPMSADRVTGLVLDAGLEGLGALVSSSGRSRVFLVADERALSFWGDELDLELSGLEQAGRLLIRAEEAAKTVRTLESAWMAMRQAGLRRSADAVVCFGGGLVCDVGALAASTYLRGLPLILVPSTLLCQVDACLGGKTAVNLGDAKNQLGTFYPAESVWIATRLLATLEPGHFRGGLGEALKTSLVGDASIAAGLLARVPGAGEPGFEDWASSLVERCLRVKGAIVTEDLLETGRRVLLNAGHTLGHALESASGFGLTHGEAVAAGLVLEARMAELLEGSAPGLSLELAGMLPGLGIGFAGLSRSPGALADFLERDKKTGRGGQRTWVLPFGWEDCRPTLLSPSEESRLLGSLLEEDAAW
ncbi:3-dehydroquinate synthase [Candidatus Fermentibacterales bacterium]|nr:3-dehydroquinate synthase [Candidatus Fermentibacterales bacterium]